MARVTVSELNQQTARVLDRIKAGESVEVSEYGQPIARIVPIAPRTGVPLLDELIGQGRAIPAAMPGLVPPTPPRTEADREIQLTDVLAAMRDDERY